MAGKNINYTVVERTSPISKKHYVMSQVIPTGSLNNFARMPVKALRSTRWRCRRR